MSTLTGTQVLLLVVSETGLVYTFTTPKLQPLVTKPEGKNLIQSCLNAPDASMENGSMNASPSMVSLRVSESCARNSHTFHVLAACVGNCKFIWGQSSKVICQSLDQKDDTSALSCLYIIAIIYTFSLFHSFSSPLKPLPLFSFSLSRLICSTMNLTTLYIINKIKLTIYIKKTSMGSRCTNN